MNPDRVKVDLQVAVPLPNHPNDVPDGSTCRGSNDAEALGEEWNGFFVFRIEESLFFKASLHLLIGKLERPQTPGFHHIHQELVFTARLVNTHPGLT